MKVRVVWYDFAGNERHCKYNRVVDVIIADNGALLLFNKDIEDMSFKGALAVYAAGDWHHIERFEVDKDIDIPNVYKEAE